MIMNNYLSSDCSSIKDLKFLEFGQQRDEVFKNSLSGTDIFAV